MNLFKQIVEFQAGSTQGEFALNLIIGLLLVN